jgi:hypothetical protein
VPPCAHAPLAGARHFQVIPGHPYSQNSELEHGGGGERGRGGELLQWAFSSAAAGRRHHYQVSGGSGRGQLAGEGGSVEVGVAPESSQGDDAGERSKGSPE